MLQIYKRYSDKGIKIIGFLDIETQADNFKADRGHIVSAVLRKLNTESGKYTDKIFCINKKDIDLILKHRHLERKNCLDFDKRVLKELVKELKTCNMIVGHYSNYFDIPFIRSRCNILKIPFIKRSDNIRFMDTWLISKNTLKLSRNSLDNVGDAVGVKIKKTKVKYLMWKLSLYGYKPALKYILHHNINDVGITFGIWKKIECYTQIPSRYF